MRIALLGFGSVGKGIAHALKGKNLGIIITALCDSKSGVIRKRKILIRA